jgi:hypothetical protein
MKIAAGCIALLVALILLGGALMDYSDDAKNAATNIHQGFDAIRTGDDTDFNRLMAEADARKTSEEVRAIAGAAFLVAGLFILAKRKQSGPTT